MMKKYIIAILTLILFTLFGATVFAQKKPPYYVLPNETHTFETGSDTLWVLTDKQINKTIRLIELLESKNREINLLEVQNNKLKAQVDSQKVLIDTLKIEREHYYQTWNECNKEVISEARKNVRQKKITRIVGIVGAVTTVAAFFAGGYFIRI